MPGTRYRAPQAPSTALITPEGHLRLREELEQLWRERRPEVVRALAAAAAEGDRSENAEYTYRKKQLAEIDRRVRYLSKRLDILRVVEPKPHDPRVIYFGAWCLLECQEGREHHFRIVGPDEIDPKRQWISVDSPLARAALKRRIDEEFEALLPRGPMRFLVLDVSYSGPLLDSTSGGS